MSTFPQGRRFGTPGRNRTEDPLIVRELQSITQEIVEEGITVLLVEQNLDFCLTLAQRHYLMDQGKIVYHGTNEEFMANDEMKDRYLTLSCPWGQT